MDLNKQLQKVVVEVCAIKAVQVLNEILRHEPDVIRELFALKFNVSKEVIDHPTIQFFETEGSYKLSVLGLINGLLGIRKDGYGYITAIYDGDKLIEFEFTSEWKDS